MDNHNYPLGADNPKAPWNQPDSEEKEISVFVSITLSKSIKIKVSDYDITDSGIDEDGHYYEVVDYSNCDLINAVREQVTLPHEAGNLMKEIDNDVILTIVSTKYDPKKSVLLTSVKHLSKGEGHDDIL